MFQPTRQAIVIVCTLIAGGASYWALAVGSEPRVADAGFWFEDVTFASPRLGAPVTRAEVEGIERVARAELASAFAGLRVALSDRRDASYRVRVVQELRDRRFRRVVNIAGESRAVSGFGGLGAVSFDFLASGAVAYAPEGSTREAMIEAIGRGIGRSAVHEFTHQLLPTAPIHDSTDVRSYEYASATRIEQYFGELHWDLARPLLQQRLR
jgi:hypothetical protein